MIFRSTVTCLTLVVPVALFAQPDLDQQLKELQERYVRLQDQEKALLAELETTKLAVISRDLNVWGLPGVAADERVIQHPAHALVYSEAHEQARWTAHIVTPDIITGNLARIDTFLPDPQVPTGTATTPDYWNSGYDRGHLVPSADMRWSYAAMKASYYYSNVSPQLPELNRGTWAELEDWVRSYVTFGKERVFAVTGPVLHEGLPKLNNPGHENEVSIPEAFFKVIADLDGEEVKGLAFVMKNGLNDLPPYAYAVPIDSVERLTGIDFFPALDDATEARIEAMRDPKAWYAKDDPLIGEVEPLKAPLPKGMYNTVQARYHVGSKATVCGTVVSTHRTRSDAVYLNMDRNHPHQDFYATIWGYDGPNFSYDPGTALLNKVICVTGKVTLYEDIPRISINNESEITFWGEVKP